MALNPTGKLNPISFKFIVGGGVVIEKPKIPLLPPIDKPGVGCLKLGYILYVFRLFKGGVEDIGGKIGFGVRIGGVGLEVTVPKKD
jgi:hypothetical protein